MHITTAAAIAVAGFLLSVSPPAAEAQDAALVLEAREPAETAPADASSAEESLTRQAIMSIQRGLSRQGYDVGAADGVPGPKTRGAIRAYQKDRGLKVTGAPTTALRDRLLADLEPQQPDDERVETGSRQAAPANDAPAVPLTTRSGTAEEIAAGSLPAVEAPDTRRHEPGSRSRDLGELEMAIITLFNFLRDTSLFVVRSFDDEEAGENADSAPQAVAESSQTPAEAE